MNKVILTGSIATEPKKITDKVVIINVVAIGKYSPKEKRNITDLVPVKVLGNKAKYVLEAAEVGQQIEVVGKMGSRKTESSFYCDVIAIDIRLGHKSLVKKEPSVLEDVSFLED